MNRFELVLDGDIEVGNFKDIFVEAIEYGDKNYLKDDELDFMEKAEKLASKMIKKSIGSIVNVIRANGLNLDKVLIDGDGICFGCIVQSFSKNVFLVAFEFDFGYMSFMAYPD